MCSLVILCHFHGSLSVCNILEKVIVLVDRGYESFNNITHLQEKEWNFIIRAKESYGMISKFQLPDSEEFDVDTTLSLMHR